MNNRHLRLLGGVSALALAAFAAPALAAADPQGSTIEEVVVTAQKRAESIQDVPLSIMAASDKVLTAKNVQEAKGLERVVPSLRLDAFAQASAVAVRIRGFGSQSNFAIDPSVAPYIDGVFIPRAGSILTSFLDVESVEVLRGPQGTLFGRNATVGALSVRTYAPSTSGFSGHASIQGGSYGTWQAEGAVNVPVSDDFAIRFAALANTTDGYIKNKLDGQTYGASNTTEGRLSAKWTPTDSITWIGRADYARTSGDGAALVQVDTSTATPQQLATFTARLGGNVPTLTNPPTYDANQRLANLNNLRDTQWGISSDLSWNPGGGGYTLRLIDSYRDWQNHQDDGDLVWTPLDILGRNGSFDSKSQSHELQLISPKGALLDGKLDFVAGLYYFDEDYKTTEAFNLGSQYCSFVVGAAAPPLVGICNAAPKVGAANGRFQQSATSKAIYAQATYKLLPTLDLILGARETQDKKSGSFLETTTNPTVAVLRVPENTPLSFKDSQPSWRANLSWHATPDVMAFLTYSTGYKSGGFNSAGGTAVLGARRVFDSETSTDWELGVKSMFFDHRLQLNVTGYRTELTGFQDKSFNGTSFIIRNAGDIRAQGVEIEGQARPVDHVGVDFGVAYLDSVFTANHNAPGLPGCTGAANSCPTVQDLTGQTPTYSPKWQGNIGAQYETDPFLSGFTATLRADVSYTSGMFTSNDLNPQSRIGGVTLVGSRITLTSPDKTWNVALFGDNLADKVIFRTKFPQVLDTVLGVQNRATGATLMRGFLSQPRTWGVKVSKSF